jgi:hypothetical protein
MDHLLRTSPFSHLIIAALLRPETESNCIELLDAAEWSRTSGDYFKFDIPSSTDIVPEINQIVGGDGFWNAQRRIFEQMFDCDLSTPILLDIHRYVEGCGLGPHTDAPCNEVRCVLNINRHWEAKDGAVWVIASDSRLISNRSFLPSMSNTGFAFPTGLNSFHALATCLGGVKYSLVARFSRR